MTKKRYEVRGMMEWHPVFRAGLTRVQVSFTGGHLCGGASTAASFETSDPVVQLLIERSEAFRSGRITLRSCSSSGLLPASTAPEGPRAVSVAPRREGDIPSPHETVMEFEDLDKASDFLQRYKGIRIDDIVTRDQCVAEARRFGIDLKIKDSAAP